MPDETRGNDPSDDPRTQPSPHPPVTAALSASPEHKIPNNANDAADNQQSTAKELAREFRWVEFAQLAVNGALAVIGIFALCIYSGQLAVMRGQLGEIVKQYPELRKSAQAAADSVTTTRDNAHLDQRAWVALEKFKVQRLRYGLPEIYFTFVNSGKTPATRVKTSVDWRSAKGSIDPDVVCRDVNKWHLDAPYIPPFGRFELREPTHDPIFLNNAINNYWEKQFNTEKPYGCIFGEVTYFDVSEAPHFTHFCLYANAPEVSKDNPTAESTDVGYCHGFNDLN